MSGTVVKKPKDLKQILLVLQCDSCSGIFHLNVELLGAAGKSYLHEPMRSVFDGIGDHIHENLH